MKRARSNSDYANQSLTNGLKVLRALINAPARGYTIKELADSSGTAYDATKRALLTMEMEPFRFARRFMGAWKPGDGLRVLAARTDLAFTRQDNDVLNLADSMRQI
jgi:DNA-binding IclR family transcriptional regulator